MTKSFGPILSVQDVAREFSWQTKVNGGHAENVETDTTKTVSQIKQNLKKKKATKELNNIYNAVHDLQYKS